MYYIKILYLIPLIEIQRILRDFIPVLISEYVEL